MKNNFPATAILHIRAEDTEEDSEEMGRPGSVSIPGSAEGWVPETSQGFVTALQGRRWFCQAPSALLGSFHLPTEPRQG